MGIKKFKTACGPRLWRFKLLPSGPQAASTASRGTAWCRCGTSTSTALSRARTRQDAGDLLRRLIHWQPELLPKSESQTTGNRTSAIAQATPASLHCCPSSFAAASKTPGPPRKTSAQRCSSSVAGSLSAGGGRRSWVGGSRCQGI